MRWVIPALALFVVSGPADATRTSGLWGVATRGPVAPVCRAGTPCTAPAVGVRLLFSRGGVVRGGAVTTALGRYRITLQPGVYSITLARTIAGRPGFLHEPLTVRVVAGRYRRADVSIDTGIR